MITEKQNGARDIICFVLEAKRIKDVLRAPNSPREINFQVHGYLRHIELLYRIISSGNTKAVSQRKHKLNLSDSDEKLNRKCRSKSLKVILHFQTIVCLECIKTLRA